MALGAFVFHRERVRDKQRKWIGERNRASLLRREIEKETEKENAQETAPMIETRASLAAARGGRPLTVTWQ